jgi:hypothetical protein
MLQPLKEMQLGFLRMKSTLSALKTPFLFIETPFLFHQFLGREVWKLT